MISRSVIYYFTLFCTASALIEFDNSKLYDETDFAQTVYIQFCTGGCRIFASIPEDSAEIAKNIVVQDTNLYEISRKQGDDNEKGFHSLVMPAGQAQVDIINNNPNGKTAPMAVWIVKETTDGINDYHIYEAGSSIPAKPLDRVTFMSAEPFSVRSTTDGPNLMLGVFAGPDAIIGTNDDCTQFIAAMEEKDYRDFEIAVQSPMVSFFFDGDDYIETKVAIATQTGLDDPFDFSRLAFVASQGYTCKGTKAFHSSNYPASSKIEFVKSDRLYDVTISGTLNNKDIPVTIKDYINNKDYLWSGNAAQEITVTTNDLEISWTSNTAASDQSFLISLTPSNEQIRTTTAVPEDTTTEESKTTTAEPEKTTTEEIKTSSAEPKTTTPQPTKGSTSSVGPDTTTENSKTSEEPAKSTVTTPEASTKRTTRVSSTIPTTHPKSTVYASSTASSAASTTTTARTTTTSGAAFVSMSVAVLAALM